MLIHCVDKRQFYKISLGLFTGVSPFGYAFKNGVVSARSTAPYREAYFHHDLIGNIVIIAFVVMWTSLVYYLSFHMPDFAKQALSRWSKNITTIYCVHWLIIGWSLTILPLPLSLPWILLFFVALLAVSGDLRLLFAA